MAVSRRGSPTFSSTQSSTTLTISLPSGITEGDLIFLLVGNGEDSPQPSITTPPSGYTALGSQGFYDYGAGGISTHLYYKVAGASESNPSITWNTGNSNGGGIWALAAAYQTSAGWHETTPVALLSSGLSTSASSTPQADAFDLGYGAFCLHFLQSSDNNTHSLNTANGWSTPAGGNTTSGSDGSVYVTEQALSAGTGQAHPVWSLDLGPDYYSWRTVALREVGAEAYTLPVDAASLTASGQAVAGKATVETTPATLTCVGAVLGFVIGATMAVDHATLTAAPQDITLSQHQYLPVTAASLTVAGQSVSGDLKAAHHPA